METLARVLVVHVTNVRKGEKTISFALKTLNTLFAPPHLASIGIINLNTTVSGKTIGRKERL